MRTSDYSTATIELIRNGMDEHTAFEGLKRVLHKRGHERLYPKILRAMKIATVKHEKRNIITVTVARDEDIEIFKVNIDRAVASLEGKDFETHIDTTITGGFIAESSEGRIDASYEKRLLTLYRSLIA
jgi:F0F1-type ATP synthase delta subunit